MCRAQSKQKKKPNPAINNRNWKREQMTTKELGKKEQKFTIEIETLGAYRNEHRSKTTKRNHNNNHRD